MYEFSLPDLLAAMASGVPFCIGVYAIQNSTVSRWFRGLIALCCVAVFAIAAWLWFPAIHMDEVVWWRKGACKHAILITLMLLGMAVSALVRAIDERHDRILAQNNMRGANKLKLRIDKWEFFRPFLFCWLTYGSLNSQIGGGTVNMATALLSIQTGFFWQTCVGKKSELGGSNSKGGRSQPTE